jgi:phosphatidylserine/phosphatidylglycerophosphate/cardiolipin synthase-like enzyme
VPSLNLFKHFSQFIFSALLIFSTLLASADEAYFMSDNSDVAMARLHYTRQENVEVFASFFVYDGPRVGKAGLAELRSAARRGAKTRLIVDGWGVEWWDGGIDLASIAALKSEGVEVRFFNPVVKHRFLKWFRSKYWTRSHDKLIYLGGQKMFSIGDLNMQNVNFRENMTPEKLGKSYISTETFFKGDAAEDVKKHLEDIWLVSEEYDTSKVTKEQIINANRKLDRMMQLTNSIAEKVLSKIDWNARMQPISKVSFISESPDEKGKSYRLQKEQLYAMSKAKERIVIYSPYSLLDGPYYNEILSAVQRGVDVTVFVPLGEKTNNPVSTSALVPLAKKLISIGVKIREVEIQDKSLINSPDMLHAKGMVVDNFYVNTTSHNFNNRSNDTDIESAAIVHDEAFVKKQIEPFLGMLYANSREYIVPTGFQSFCKVLGIKWLRKIKVIGKQL